MAATVTILDSWGHLACLLFGSGAAEFKLNTMYIEFGNVASPGDVVTAPTVARSEDRSYYEGLAGDRDYLRVALLGTPEITAAPGFEVSFPDGGGNRAVFYAQTAGLTGMHGLPFSDAVNSVVYGIALVAAPDRADRTRDVVFGRAYYDPADQIPKEPGRQIGVSWDQIFGEL